MQEDEVWQVDTGQIPQGLIICGKELGFKSKCGKTTGGFRHAVSAVIWDDYLNNPALCCSVAKLCPTLCDPWTAARQASLSFTVSRSLLKLISIESMMLSNHLILCCPLLLLPSIFPRSGSFSVTWLFTSGGWSIGASASATSLPLSIQGWFPLGLTDLILLFMGLSRVFSSTTHRKHGTEPLWSISHFHAAVRL